MREREEMLSTADYLDYRQEQFKKMRRETICRDFCKLRIQYKNKVTVRLISGFLRYWKELFALLGCYAALIGSHGRFGTTYWSQPQGSNGPAVKLFGPVDL